MRRRCVKQRLFSLCVADGAPFVELTHSILLDGTTPDVEIAVQYDACGAVGDIGRTFYTDSNGFQVDARALVVSFGVVVVMTTATGCAQMQRRDYTDMMPVSGNFYPVSSTAFVQNDDTRFNGALERRRVASLMAAAQ